MAAASTNKKVNRRSRKKRRTEDFSSDSESSSSSSESEPETEEQTKQDNTTPKETQSNINIDDIEIDSDNEQKPSHRAPEKLSLNQKQQLNNIPFVTTPISNLTTNSTNSIPNINQISSNIDEQKKNLQNQYLKLMASEFSDDLDELRKKPDFTDKSLVILAKTLQSGANMFDPEVLANVL
ncbi:Ribosome assembly protein 3 [Spathaspora sp. JA1]|nr:Ribosome assembly protein 3 [Spathaspora sp. JA1]